ncbi:hypothetical protein [Actinacidiphila sp. ITFR-21]|uniref:hypothetical protein n=1 Tax=Actinacidiphila sp. ITFR-21 TaxID=3075199 RepID=UPI002889587D|nr:hypothetical protein [Streptomyces sp. ITFR-21]WNI15543.1 hypothetical protein RLT57_08405 [Streptomyces sp. ITFR-21]
MADPSADLAFLRALLYALLAVVTLFAVSQLVAVLGTVSAAGRARAGLAALLLALVIGLAPTHREA